MGKRSAKYVNARMIEWAERLREANVEAKKMATYGNVNLGYDLSVGSTATILTNPAYAGWAKVAVATGSIASSSNIQPGVSCWLGASAGPSTAISYQYKNLYEAVVESPPPRGPRRVPWWESPHRPAYAR